MGVTERHLFDFDIGVPATSGEEVITGEETSFGVVSPGSSGIGFVFKFSFFGTGLKIDGLNGPASCLEAGFTGFGTTNSGLGGGSK